MGAKVSGLKSARATVLRFGSGVQRQVLVKAWDPVLSICVAFVGFMLWLWCWKWLYFSAKQLSFVLGTCCQVMGAHARTHTHTHINLFITNPPAENNAQNNVPPQVYTADI